jgi:chemotaxis protein methyltransferase WspC
MNRSSIKTGMQPLPAPALSLPPAVAGVEPLLRRWIGLDVATVGPAALQRAVRIRMEALGIDRPEAYADRVATDEPERDALVEEVVVAESWFFRDPQVFEFVARFATTVTGLPGRAPVRILSAPCAAGEEPYSVAMALCDAGLDTSQFHIDAIDVSHAALARAARGRYSANAFRNADLAFRDRWFTSADGAAVIDDRLRGQVAFTWANLLDDGFRVGRGPYDVIFCRNLLIYLDAEARSRVEATLDALLRPDGMLVLGAAEPPIMKGRWMPAGAASVFALRRGPAVAGVASAHPGRSAAPPPARTAAQAHRSATPRPDRRRDAPVPPVAPPPVSAASAESAATAAAAELAAVLAEAGSLANAHRHAEALALCEAARERLGPSPELFFLMGMLHQAAGDLDRAEGCFHKTLYLDATHDEALLALALVATQRGDTRMADTYRQSATRVLARKDAP